MKRLLASTIRLLVILSGIIPLGTSWAMSLDGANPGIGNGNTFFAGKMVVANRNSGTISIINTNTDQVVDTITLPDTNPEPMYVVYTHVTHRVFVGDRSNNQVVVYDADDFSVEDTVPTGNGVFHMWADPQNSQLWVINDADKTATVIDPTTLQVLTTVPMPTDLVTDGGKPHDVVLDTQFAYVTMIGLVGGNDYVVKFSRRTFQEVDRLPVGKDTHVSLTLRNHLLYVPTQQANEVLVLNRRTLEEVTSIPVPGAHGAGMARNGKTFYITNISGGGTNGLFAINTKTNTLVPNPTDTPNPVPHNIALTPNGQKIYVTHSGATADTVTVYTATKQDPVPLYKDTIIVETNPFGLAFVP